MPQETTKPMNFSSSLKTHPKLSIQFVFNPFHSAFLIFCNIDSPKVF